MTLKAYPVITHFFPCCGSKSCLWLQILYRESHQTTLNTILTTEDKRRITLHEETHIQDGESLITLFNMHCSAHHLQKKNNNNLSTMLWLIKKDYKCHFRVSYTQNVAKKTASHVFIFEDLMNECCAESGTSRNQTLPAVLPLYNTVNNSVHQLFNFQLLNQNADKGFY